MKVSSQITRYFISAILCAMIVLVSFNAYSALSPGITYTVILSKVNSNGTVTQVNSTSATADSNGKISFSFSRVPTSPDTFFLVLTVKDSSGTIVRKSFVPAPPSGGTGELGINDLSTTQTEMILQALESAGTDDPIVAAYGLILTRTADTSDADIQNIATLGRLAIQQGFESFLTSNGVSAAQLTTFKQKLIYNQPNKDLSNFTTLFKSAVDNPAQSADDMAMAAGLIADIFIDAGIAANIDLSLILAAHDAAGDVVQNNAEAAVAFAGISGSTGSVIDAAMSNFFIRIAAVKVKTNYTHALTVLNATGTQVTNFNTAVQTLMNAMQTLDKQYAQYYSNPALMTQQIRDAMNTAYSDAFTTFQTNIASSDAEILTMKTNMATALGINLGDLPAGMGTYRDFNANTVNWPIPQVVAINWVASIITAGGSLTYDRNTVSAGLPVPGNMGWLNGDGSRGNFGGMPASFASLMGVQEDLQIAENTRWSIFGGGQPTREQEKAAKLAYNNNVDLIITNLSGTTNGSTSISLEQKEALVKMMEHPELN